MYLADRSGFSGGAGRHIDMYSSHRLERPDAARREFAERGFREAKLGGSQLIGVTLMRYVLKMEPLASVDVDTLVAWLGPTLQRYLVDDLPRGENPAPGHVPSPDEATPKQASRRRHAEGSRT